MSLLELLSLIERYQIKATITPLADGQLCVTLDSTEITAPAKDIEQCIREAIHSSWGK